MPDHCPYCPFKGCPDCLYRGGGNVAAQRDSQPELWDNGACAGHKSAPEVRQHNEGLTTGTSPFDSTEGGKPMASRNATPLTGSAAARLDGCPSCVINTEVPYGGWTEPNGSVVCCYVCADCGYRWHTSWMDSWGEGDV